jgi:hypothetical protein
LLGAVESPIRSPDPSTARDPRTGYRTDPGPGLGAWPGQGPPGPGPGPGLARGLARGLGQSPGPLIRSSQSTGQLRRSLRRPPEFTIVLPKRIRGAPEAGGTITQELQWGSRTMPTQNKILFACTAITEPTPTITSRCCAGASAAEHLRGPPGVTQTKTGSKTVISRLRREE